MDSSHLSTEQVVALRAVVGRELRYLNKLCARMQVLRFPPDDALCRAAQRARDALQDLYTAAHYCRCSASMGKVGPEMDRSAMGRPPSRGM